VPRHLIGRETEIGPIPLRLTPIFRDSDELAASPDIGADLRTAVCASQFLIVLCSPAAAKSRWVNAEIEIFRAHRPENERRILCVVVCGEPDSEMECFPPALRKSGSDTGMPSHFPLAADFRPGAGRRDDAELRLIAALLGVTFDELKRRDHVQRIRNLRRALAAAAALIFVLAGLTTFAFFERAQAQKSTQHATRARVEAEKLVDFMIVDLRDKLESLGKLSLLEPANEKVRRYYETVAPEEENTALLHHRSVVLAEHGDDLMAKGDTKAAAEFYNAAKAIRERIASLEPKESLSQYDLADIHTRLAEAARVENNLTSARTEQAAALSVFDRLVQNDSRNANFQYGLAKSLVGIAYIHLQEGQSDRAEKEFRHAIEIFNQLMSIAPAPGVTFDCIAALSQLGDTLRKTGKKAEAEADLRRSISLGDNLLQKDPDNVKLLGQLQVSRTRLSLILGESDRPEEALQQRREGLTISRRLVALEPGNVEFQRCLSSACLMIDELLCQLNQCNEGELYLREALSITEKLVAEHPDDKRSLADLPSCLNHFTEFYLAVGKPEEALKSTERAIDVRRKICSEDPANREMKHWLAYDIFCSGSALLDLKRPTEAEKCARESLGIADEIITADPANLVPLQFRALYELQLGAALRDQRRIDESRAAYRKCLQTVGQYTAKGGLAQSVHYPREEAEKALQRLDTVMASK